MVLKYASGSNKFKSKLLVNGQSFTQPPFLSHRLTPSGNKLGVYFGYATRATAVKERCIPIDNSASYHGASQLLTRSIEFFTDWMKNYSLLLLLIRMRIFESQFWEFQQMRWYLFCFNFWTSLKAIERMPVNMISYQLALETLWKPYY
jgi:hypothetical protein